MDLGWLGTVYTDWNTGDNWGWGKVPTISNNVLILSGVTLMPMLSTNGHINAVEYKLLENKTAGWG